MSAFGQEEHSFIVPAVRFRSENSAVEFMLLTRLSDVLRQPSQTPVWPRSSIGVIEADMPFGSGRKPPLLENGLPRSGYMRHVFRRSRRPPASSCWLRRADYVPARKRDAFFCARSFSESRG
jgi:hypothetical protein